MLCYDQSYFASIVVFVFCFQLHGGQPRSIVSFILIHSCQLNASLFCVLTLCFVSLTIILLVSNIQLIFYVGFYSVHFGCRRFFLSSSSYSILSSFCNRLFFICFTIIKNLSILKTHLLCNLIFSHFHAISFFCFFFFRFINRWLHDTEVNCLAGNIKVHYQRQLLWTYFFFLNGQYAVDTPHSFIYSLTDTHTPIVYLLFVSYVFHNLQLS